MILVSSLVFWIILVIGAACLAGVITTSAYLKKAKAITPQEVKLYQTLFQLFFLGFLLFGFTPLFFWLLFLPV